jgi:CysZ protein
MYFFAHSSNDALRYLNNLTGIDRWLQQQKSSLLSFFFVMGSVMVQLILLLFYFSLFKYLILLFGSPLFAYLSEKTEAILEGKEYPFSFTVLFKDILRGSGVALRNTLWQTVYTITLLIVSFIPVVGWITPVIAFFVECYYYGFSMLDYSCARHKLTPAESVEYIGKHKGLAIGNGLLFFLMHVIPVVGWILAPAYAICAATLSLYYQKKEV